MDWVRIRNRIKDTFEKNKFVLLIFGLGLILLVMPTVTGSNEQKEVIQNDGDNILSVEDQLSQLLSNVKDAGKVQVMLSIASGEETLYQTNDDHTTNADNASEKTDTVIIADSDRSESGLVRQINPPVYSGAIIVCQGADNPSVKYAVVEAVSKLTGLGTDKISVLKMK